MHCRSFVVSCAVVLAACASQPPPPQPASGASSAQVSGAEAKKLVGQGAKLVDVRTPAEYAEKHVEGAINVPVDSIAERDLGPKDGAIVLYCHSGRRAEQAAATLRTRGYTHVTVLGAMSRWDE